MVLLFSNLIIGGRSTTAAPPHLSRLTVRKQEGESVRAQKIFRPITLFQWRDAAFHRRLSGNGPCRNNPAVTHVLVRINDHIPIRRQAQPESKIVEQPQIVDQSHHFLCGRQKGNCCQ